jgi:ABC-type spermidine/putrescine transport system permease subunit II
MKAKTIIEYLVCTTPGLILAAGIILLFTGIFTSDEEMVSLGLGFVVFSVVVGIVFAFELWGARKFRERRRDVPSVP